MATLEKPDPLSKMPHPQFSVGRVVGTPGALAALKEAGHTPAEFLDRHICGDWGDVSAEDAAANEHALEHGLRVLSVYTTNDKVRIFILTEADRSYTTVMLPEDY